MDAAGKPIQTYSREADRIATEIVRYGSTQKMSALLTAAIQAQADEIASFLIARSRRLPPPRPDGGRA